MVIRHRSSSCYLIDLIFDAHKVEFSATLIATLIFLWRSWKISEKPTKIKQIWINYLIWFYLLAFSRRLWFLMRQVIDIFVNICLNNNICLSLKKYDDYEDEHFENYFNLQAAQRNLNKKADDVPVPYSAARIQKELTELKQGDD